MPNTFLPRSVLFATATILAAPLVCAQQILFQCHGDQPGAGFGRALAAVGDTDGDGTVDLVVGEPLRDFGSVPDAGAAALLRTGPNSIPFRSYGAQVGGHLGGTVAGLGDVDGDGVKDWACGAPDPVLGTGLVRVLSGASGSQLHEIQGALLARFGAAICSVGDRDLDGRADFAVGQPQVTPTSPFGIVKVFSGQSGLLLTTLASGGGTRFGSSLATLRDLTNDGNVEFAIGEPGADGNGTDAGAVRVKNPRVALSSSYLWSAFTSFGAGQQGGGVLAELGDANGDGYTDVLAGTATGGVVGLSGQNGSVLFLVQNAEFGATPSLAGIGDWDGDGQVDFAVGSASADFGNGRVWVYSTAPGTPMLSTIYGPLGAGFGAAVAGIGDWNGDGRCELAVGSPGELVNGQVLGRVTVHTFDIAASVVPFGQGCGVGTNQPPFFHCSRPAIGTSLRISAGGLRPGSAAMCLLGFSATATAGVPLPLSLQPYGVPCTLYVSLDVAIGTSVDPYGGTYYQFPLPADHGLVGVQLHTQYAAFEPQAPGGMLFTSAARIRIGNF